MKINHKCEKCLLDRQILAAQAINDETARASFIQEITDIMDHREENEPAAYVVHKFNGIYERYGLKLKTFPKQKYNQMLLDMEDEIEDRIKAADDPLKMALAFARIGNYIDFGAFNQVDDSILQQLIQEADRQIIDEKTYADFCARCAAGKTFLLLCDNCGEIVLDKLLLRRIKERYPQLSMFAMVRGGEISNDATIEDAVYSGLDREATLIDNAYPIAGVIYHLLDEQRRSIFDCADVVLAKGQGNYETLSGHAREIFFLFLCKCDFFVERFQVPRLTGMFIHEQGEQ